MDKLTQKLEELKKAAEQVVPTIKSPKPPKPPTLDDLGAPEAPKAGAAASKKDPVKAAEQLKDTDLKTEAVKQAKNLKEGVKFNTGGQWAINKAEEDKGIGPQRYMDFSGRKHGGRKYGGNYNPIATGTHSHKSDGSYSIRHEVHTSEDKLGAVDTHHDKDGNRVGTTWNLKDNPDSSTRLKSTLKDHLDLLDHSKLPEHKPGDIEMKPRKRSKPEKQPDAHQHIEVAQHVKDSSLPDDYKKRILSAIYSK
jgi:hypothetical protein